MIEIKVLVFIFGSVLFNSCTNTSYCEKHFIQKGFTGKVKILFGQADGQQHLDKDGCIVFQIPINGECLSSFPFKEVNRFKKNTFECFEVAENDSIKIPVFREFEYLQDSAENKLKKYVFLNASGFENPTGTDPRYVLEYYIDYGTNYRMY